jgi:hypothetical protein
MFREKKLDEPFECNPLRRPFSALGESCRLSQSSPTVRREGEVHRVIEEEETCVCICSERVTARGHRDCCDLVFAVLEIIFDHKVFGSSSVDSSIS